MMIIDGNHLDLDERNNITQAMMRKTSAGFEVKSQKKLETNTLNAQKRKRLSEMQEYQNLKEQK